MKLVALPDRAADRDDELVKVFEELLENARAGRISSFAGVVIDRATHSGRRVQHHATNMECLGAVVLLQSWLTEQVEQCKNDSPEPPAAA